MFDPFNNPADAMAYIMKQSDVDKDAEPLLTIELQDMNSVPVVKYKGEEIKMKTHVTFDWEQRTDETFGGVEIDIEHHVSGEGEKEIGHFNTIRKIGTFKGGKIT